MRNGKRTALFLALFLFLLPMVSVFSEGIETSTIMILLYDYEELVPGSEVNIEVRLFDKGEYVEASGINLTLEREGDELVIDKNLSSKEPGIYSFTHILSGQDVNSTSLKFSVNARFGRNGAREWFWLYPDQSAPSVPRSRVSIYLDKIAGSGIYDRPGDRYEIEARARYNNTLVDARKILAWAEGEDGNGDKLFNHSLDLDTDEVGIYRADYSVPDMNLSYGLVFHVRMEHNGSEDEKQRSLEISVLQVFLRVLSLDPDELRGIIFASGINESLDVDIDFGVDIDSDGTAPSVPTILGREGRRLDFEADLHNATRADVMVWANTSDLRQYACFKMRIRDTPSIPSSGLSVESHGQLYVGRNSSVNITVYNDGTLLIDTPVYYYAYNESSVILRGQVTTNTSGSFTIDIMPEDDLLVELTLNLPLEEAGPGDMNETNDGMAYAVEDIYLYPISYSPEKKEIVDYSIDIDVSGFSPGNDSNVTVNSEGYQDMECWGYACPGTYDSIFSAVNNGSYVANVPSPGDALFKLYAVNDTRYRGRLHVPDLFLTNESVTLIVWFSKTGAHYSIGDPSSLLVLKPYIPVDPGPGPTEPGDGQENVSDDGGGGGEDGDDTSSEEGPDDPDDGGGGLVWYISLLGLLLLLVVLLAFFNVRNRSR